MRLLNYFFSLYRAGSPFTNIGLYLFYVWFVVRFFRGWLLFFLLFFNPLTLRALFRLWRSRRELLELAENAWLSLRKDEDDD